jgi:hypothetical protein
VALTRAPRRGPSFVSCNILKSNDIFVFTMPLLFVNTPKYTIGETGATVSGVSLKASRKGWSGHYLSTPFWEVDIFLWRIPYQRIEILPRSGVEVTMAFKVRGDVVVQRPEVTASPVCPQCRKQHQGQCLQAQANLSEGPNVQDNRK